MVRMLMRPDADRVIGESPSFLRVLEQVSLIAPLEKPVLIVGERGTGKELIAARLHFLSNRWESQYLSRVKTIHDQDDCTVARCVTVL